LDNLHVALDKGDLDVLLAGLRELAAAYPLDLTGILPAEATPNRRRRAQDIHETYCAGCHDEPDLEVERPAYNLFDQARSLSPQEFAARMITGVRGDRLTNLQNPLSDEEIAALIAYYRTGKGPE
jgi:mono/diheme cytochrome c family protein